MVAIIFLTKSVLAPRASSIALGLLAGKIDVPPQYRAKITPFIGGYVKSSQFLVGDKVAKGQVLVTLENTEYLDIQKDYVEVAEQIGYLKSEYERQKTLYDEKITSQKNYLKAESDYKKAFGMYQSLKKKLQLLNISPAQVEKGNLTSVITLYAPITGDVTQMNANVGMFMSPSDIILEIVDIEHLHVELNVFEKDLGKLFIGQEVVTYTNNDPKNKHLAEILLIGKDLGEDRSTEVHCHFEDYDKTLIPGTYMNAEVQIKANNSFVLPEDAVVSFENKKYAFVKKSAKEFEMIPVETGVVENGFIEVLNGKQLANETFVQKGAYTLLMTLKNKAEEE